MDSDEEDQNLNVLKSFLDPIGEVDENTQPQSPRAITGLPEPIDTPLCGRCRSSMSETSPQPNLLSPVAIPVIKDPLERDRQYLNRLENQLDTLKKNLAATKMYMKKVFSEKEEVSKRFKAQKNLLMKQEKQRDYLMKLRLQPSKKAISKKPAALNLNIPVRKASDKYINERVPDSSGPICVDPTVRDTVDARFQSLVSDDRIEDNLTENTDIDVHPKENCSRLPSREHMDEKNGESALLDESNPGNVPELSSFIPPLGELTNAEQRSNLSDDKKIDIEYATDQEDSSTVSKFKSGSNLDEKTTHGSLMELTSSAHENVTPDLNGLPGKKDTPSSDDIEMIEYGRNILSAKNRAKLPGGISTLKGRIPENTTGEGKLDGVINDEVPTKNSPDKESDVYTNKEMAQCKTPVQNRPKSQILSESLRDLTHLGDGSPSGEIDSEETPEKLLVEMILNKQGSSSKKEEPQGGLEENDACSPDGKNERSSRSRAKRTRSTNTSRDLKDDEEDIICSSKQGNYYSREMGSPKNENTQEKEIDCEVLPRLSYERAEVKRSSRSRSKSSSKQSPKKGESSISLTRNDALACSPVGKAEGKRSARTRTKPVRSASKLDDFQKSPGEANSLNSDDEKIVTTGSQSRKEDCHEKVMESFDKSQNDLPKRGDSACSSNGNIERKSGSRIRKIRSPKLVNKFSDNAKTLNCDDIINAGISQCSLQENKVSVSDTDRLQERECSGSDLGDRTSLDDEILGNLQKDNSQHTQPKYIPSSDKNTSGQNPKGATALNNMSPSPIKLNESTKDILGKVTFKKGIPTKNDVVVSDSYELIPLKMESRINQAVIENIPEEFVFLNMEGSTEEYGVCRKLSKEKATDQNGIGEKKPIDDLGRKLEDPAKEAFEKEIERKENGKILTKEKVENSVSEKKSIVKTGCPINEKNPPKIKATKTDKVSTQTLARRTAVAASKIKCTEGVSSTRKLPQNKEMNNGKKKPINAKIQSKVVKNNIKQEGSSLHQNNVVQATKNEKNKCTNYKSTVKDSVNDSSHFKSEEASTPLKDSRKKYHINQDYELSREKLCQLNGREKTEETLKIAEKPNTSKTTVSKAESIANKQIYNKPRKDVSSKRKEVANKKIADKKIETSANQKHLKTTSNGAVVSRAKEIAKQTAVGNLPKEKAINSQRNIAMKNKLNGNAERKLGDAAKEPLAELNREKISKDKTEAYNKCWKAVNSELCRTDSAGTEDGDKKLMKSTKDQGQQSMACDSLDPNATDASIMSSLDSEEIRKQKELEIEINNKTLMNTFNDEKSPKDKNKAINSHRNIELGEAAKEPLAQLKMEKIPNDKLQAYNNSGKTVTSEASKRNDSSCTEDGDKKLMRSTMDQDHQSMTRDSLDPYAVDPSMMQSLDQGEIRKRKELELQSKTLKDTIKVERSPKNRVSQTKSEKVYRERIKRKDNNAKKENERPTEKEDPSKKGESPNKTGKPTQPAVRNFQKDTSINSHEKTTVKRKIQVDFVKKNTAIQSNLQKQKEVNINGHSNNSTNAKSSSKNKRALKDVSKCFEPPNTMKDTLHEDKSISNSPAKSEEKNTNITEQDRLCQKVLDECQLEIDQRLAAYDQSRKCFADDLTLPTVTNDFTDSSATAVSKKIRDRQKTPGPKKAHSAKANMNPAGLESVSSTSNDSTPSYGDDFEQYTSSTSSSPSPVSKPIFNPSDFALSSAAEYLIQSVQKITDEMEASKKYEAEIAGQILSEEEERLSSEKEIDDGKMTEEERQLVAEIEKYIGIDDDFEERTVEKIPYVPFIDVSVPNITTSGAGTDLQSPHAQNSGNSAMKYSSFSETQQPPHKRLLHKRAQEEIRPTVRQQKPMYNSSTRNTILPPVRSEINERPKRSCVRQRDRIKFPPIIIGSESKPKPIKLGCEKDLISLPQIKSYPNNTSYQPYFRPNPSKDFQRANLQNNGVSMPTQIRNEPKYPLNHGQAIPKIRSSANSSQGGSNFRNKMRTNTNILPNFNNMTIPQNSRHVAYQPSMNRQPNNQIKTSDTYKRPKVLLPKPPKIYQSNRRQERPANKLPTICDLNDILKELDDDNN